MSNIFALVPETRKSRVEVTTRCSGSELLNKCFNRDCASTFFSIVPLSTAPKCYRRGYGCYWQQQWLYSYVNFALGAHSRTENLDQDVSIAH